MSKNYFLSKDKICPEELLGLYEAVGWNNEGQRDVERNTLMLKQAPCAVGIHQDNKLIAFGRLVTDPYVATIYDVVVHPDYRRKGLASSVITKLTEYANSQGLWLNLVDGSNVPNFYEKLGFEQGDGRVMYYEKK